MKENAGPQRRLDSWESIAQYLARSARTAQRWHAEYGLPIHRLGGNKGPLFAYADELDHWMKDCGKVETKEAPATSSPAPPDVRFLHEEFAMILDSFGLSNPAKARSAELVALAFKMWEVLSYSNLRQIARMFREAIDLDPCNADAFAGLSITLIVEGLWGLVSPPAAYTSAQAALQRTLEIDPEQPEALCAAAWLKMVSTRDWEGARRGFDEALKQAPRSTRAMVGRAMLHIAEGDLEDASHLLLRAVQQSALSSAPMSWNCWNNYLAGEFENALIEIEHYRDSGRHGPVTDAVEALAIIQLEETDVQIERIEALVAASPHNDVLRGALGYAYGMAGQRLNASEILDTMGLPKAKEKTHEPYAIALVLIGLNRINEAVERLEQSYRDGSLWSLGFRSDPILTPLRNDPHFRLFFSKVSYPVSVSLGAASGALARYGAQHSQRRRVEAASAAGD